MCRSMEPSDSSGAPVAVGTPGKNLALLSPKSRQMSQWPRAISFSATTRRVEQHAAPAWQQPPPAADEPAAAPDAREEGHDLAEAETDTTMPDARSSGHRQRSPQPEPMEPLQGHPRFQKLEDIRRWASRSEPGIRRRARFGAQPVVPPAVGESRRVAGHGAAGLILPGAARSELCCSSGGHVALCSCSSASVPTALRSWQRRASVACVAACAEPDVRCECVGPCTAFANWRLDWRIP